MGQSIPLLFPKHYYHYQYHLFALIFQILVRFYLYQYISRIAFAAPFYLWKSFFNVSKKGKKKKRKSRKRESVLILSTVYSILMPHILLNCTKREITISNIITDRRVKNVCAIYGPNVQIERTLKDSPRAYIYCRTEIKTSLALSLRTNCLRKFRH